MKTVLANTSGWSTSASISLAQTCSPFDGSAVGCSERSAAVTIQETWGSLPAAMSARKASTSCSPSERLRSGAGLMLRNPGAAAPVEVGVPVAGPERLKHREDVVPEVVVLLVDLPGDPRVLQALGVGGPAVGALCHRPVLGHVGAGGLVLAVVVHLRIAADLSAAVAAGPEVQAVGIGLGQGRGSDKASQIVKALASAW